MTKISTARLGSIVRIRIIDKERWFEVLCTIWPDYSNIVDNDVIYIDTTVIIGEEVSNWTICSCEVNANHIIAFGGD